MHLAILPNECLLWGAACPYKLSFASPWEMECNDPFEQVRHLPHHSQTEDSPHTLPHWTLTKQWHLFVWKKGCFSTIMTLNGEAVPDKSQFTKTTASPTCLWKWAKLTNRKRHQSLTVIDLLIIRWFSSWRSILTHRETEDKSLHISKRKEMGSLHSSSSGLLLMDRTTQNK